MSTTYTANYHLGKQTDISDNFDMSVITDNMDIIDSALSDKQTILTIAQLAAVNSGISNTKVEQIATNASDISDIETALSDKVDKETGKGLSTNDYTTAEKEKLAGIAEGAEVNEIQGIVETIVNKTQ